MALLSGGAVLDHSRGSDGGPRVAAVAEFHGCEEFLRVMWILPEVCSGLCHSGDTVDKFDGEESCMEIGRGRRKGFPGVEGQVVAIPVLTVPNFKLPMILHTDASDVGVVATLSQKEECG